MKEIHQGSDYSRKTIRAFLDKKGIKMRRAGDVEDPIPLFALGHKMTKMTTGCTDNHAGSQHCMLDSTVYSTAVVLNKA